MARVTILLSHERSGSHLFGEILASFTGTKVYDEVCNALAVRPADSKVSFHRFRKEWMIKHPDKFMTPNYKNQVDFLNDYFDLLIERARGASVIVDIKYGHLHHFEGMWWPLFRKPFLLTFAAERKYSVVHLYRRSVFDAVVSAHVAEARKIWHSWQEKRIEAQDKPIKLDANAVISDAKLLRMQQNWIVEHWLGVRTLSYSYEDLVSQLNSGSRFEALAEFVGGSPASSPFVLRHQKVTPPLSSIVANLDELISMWNSLNPRESNLEPPVEHKL